MNKSVSVYVVLSVLLAGTVVNLSHAEGGCYSTGQGPVMSCFEGNKKVEVREPFKHKDGNYYSWDHNANGYCYRNKYGNQRCMQEWETRALNCAKAENGSLNCE